MITFVSSLCRNRVFLLNKPLNLHKLYGPQVQLSVSNRAIGTLPKSTKSLFLRFQRWQTCNKRTISRSENKIIATEKVINNVILYKHERTLYYRLFAMFGAIQFVCLYLAASNIYTVFYDDFFKKKYNTWKQKFAELAVSGGCFVVLVLAGPIIFTATWFMVSRTVKYVYLLRGGRDIQFVTYHPVKGERTLTVPLRKVNCISSRFDLAAYIKIKISNKTYMIDRDGNFLNPELFDQTVGVQRK